MNNEFNLEAYIEEQEWKEKLSNLKFLERQKQIKEQIEQLISESPTQPTPPEDLNVHPDRKLKRIPGFLTYYANRNGEIWEWKNNNFHLVKQREGSTHYITVSVLLPSGKRKQFLVHRLIAITFHGLSPKGTPCCHRNDIKSDNRADNLYWGTPKTNSHDYQRNRKDPDYIAEKEIEYRKEIYHYLRKNKKPNPTEDDITFEITCRRIKEQSLKIMTPPKSKKTTNPKEKQTVSNKTLQKYKNAIKQQLVTSENDIIIPQQPIEREHQ